MKTIGIDINEVLRAYKKRLIYLYNKENNINIDDIDMDSYQNKDITEILDFRDEVVRNEYIDNPIDIAYTTRNNIVVDERVVTKQEKIKNFLYVDYLLELYGISGKTYTNVDLDLNKLIKKYENKYKFIIF